MKNGHLDRSVRGVCLTAPAPGETDLFVRFIDTWLAPSGCNLIVLLIRYAYQFESHPECASPNALSKADMEKIAGVCRANGIRLIPKMNLLGHQSGKTPDSLDGLLRGHPEFDETPDAAEVFYCRSLCPQHPAVKRIVCDLMDELIEVFHADGMHIGCDEVFEIGLCDRCKAQTTAALFAEWVNGLADHLARQGVQTFLWGDRLLSAEATGYGTWEASANGTEAAIDLIRRDIVICDWHYETREAYPSVDLFTKYGFSMLAAPWRSRASAEKFLDYAAAHSGKNLKGFLGTTWVASAPLARFLLDGTACADENVPLVAETLKMLFGA